MAVDEVLADSAAELGQCSLRFYQWFAPTLSLGYFQPFALREEHCASAELSIVRRASGGGAIVHDRELTYSLAVPVAHPLVSDAMRLYNTVHESLIATLAKWKIAAHRNVAPSGLPPHQEPFLCFVRRSPGDVMLSSAKICGSAQRRRRGAIVQHGSVLLQRSPAAVELPGIAELTGIQLDFHFEGGHDGRVTTIITVQVARHRTEVSAGTHQHRRLDFVVDDPLFIASAHVGNRLAAPQMGGRALQ